MYTYYCVILLWRRLLFVLSARSDAIGDADYQAFSKSLPRIVTPVEINEYLSGIGHIKDTTGAHRNLSLFRFLTDDIFNGHFTGPV